MTSFDVKQSRWLDPPEEPTHWACDGCGDIYDGGDMWQLSDKWYCDECYPEAKRIHDEENEL